MIKSNNKIITLSLIILLFSLIIQFLSGYLYIQVVTYIVYPVFFAVLARYYIFVFIKRI